jgi:hypothetical protein
MCLSNAALLVRGFFLHLGFVLVFSLYIINAAGGRRFYRDGRGGGGTSRSRKNRVRLARPKPAMVTYTVID